MIITRCGWVVSFGFCAALRPVKDVPSVRAVARNTPAPSAGRVIQQFSSVHGLNATPAQSSTLRLPHRVPNHGEVRGLAHICFDLLVDISAHICVWALGQCQGHRWEDAALTRSRIVQRWCWSLGEVAHLWNDTGWAVTLQHQRLLRTRADGHGWASVAEMQQETELHHSGHSRVSRSAAANCGIPPRFIRSIKQEFSIQEILRWKMSINKLEYDSANMWKLLNAQSILF